MSFQMQNHVSFLHEEFLKHPAFPRKALEAEFDMYHGPWGKVGDIFTVIMYCKFRKYMFYYYFFLNILLS